MPSPANPARRITCSIRIWKSLRVKVGGRLRMGEDHIVVDSSTQITVADIRKELPVHRVSPPSLICREWSDTADNVHLIQFHDLPDDVWDRPK